MFYLIKFSVEEVTFPIVFVLISKVIYYKNAISTKMCR